MKTINVEWTVKPKSGVTTFELSELGCNSLKDWKALSKAEQEKRINKALEDTDGGSLKAIALDW